MNINQQRRKYGIEWRLYWAITGQTMGNSPTLHSYFFGIYHYHPSTTIPRATSPQLHLTCPMYSTNDGREAHLGKQRPTHTQYLGFLYVFALFESIVIMLSRFFAWVSGILDQKWIV